MKDQDKVYMQKEPAEIHDPDPVEEVFASFKALIAVLAIVGAIGMLFAAWWHK